MGEQHYKRVSEKIHVYLYFLRGFFTMKVVENNPQNARNCTILKNFLGGACPQTPLTKARSFAARDMPRSGMYIQNPRILKLGPPPLEILHTPLGLDRSIYMIKFPHLLSVRRACTREKLFLSGAI